MAETEGASAAYNPDPRTEAVEVVAAALHDAEDCGQPDDNCRAAFVDEAMTAVDALWAAGWRPTDAK